MNKSTTICLIIMAITATTGCKTHNKTSEVPPMKIETTRAQQSIVNRKIWFSSALEPLYSVTIEPRINGYLERINYLNGENVKRGDMIFMIDPIQLSTSFYAAQASLESARASYMEAENNYNRAIPLAKIDAISQSDLDKYRASYVAAKSSVKSAEESLKNADLNLSYATIISPIDGVIAESPASKGDYVGPGTKFTTLTTISYNDTLKVALAIPTSQYLKYKDQNGNIDDSELLSNITLTLPDSSQYKYKATYDYTQKDITKSNSTVVIYAKVANPESLLKPNMFTRICAEIGSAEECVTLPQRAITQIQGVSSVWIIEPDSTASYRKVKIGDTFGDQWEVLSGVEAGESVATTGLLKLHQGSKVTPIYTTSK